MKQVSQLCTSRNKSSFSFVLITSKEEKIMIFKVNKGIKKVREMLLSDVIHLEYLSDEKLFIQTDTFCYIYYVNDNKIEKYHKIKNRVSSILTFRKNYIFFIYELKPGILKFKYINFKKGKEYFICEANLIDRKKIKYFFKLNLKNIKKIENFIT